MEGNFSFYIIQKMSVGNFRFHVNELILHTYLLKTAKAGIYKFYISTFRIATFKISILS